MQVKPIKKQQQQPSNRDVFVATNEWILCFEVNDYIKNLLEKNPEKIQFGIAENGGKIELYAMISR